MIVFFFLFKQLVAMRSNARRLRSACEKKAAREWKEGKYQMNKRILSDLKVSNMYYLLTEWEGHTRNYLARGPDVRTEPTRVDQYAFLARP